jgi:hypothetical protein
MRLQELRLEYRAAVVDDVRFPEEVAAIRALGGQVVRLDRAADPAAPATHASERGIPAAMIARHVDLPPIADIDLAAEALHRWAWTVEVPLAGASRVRVVHRPRRAP